MSEAVASPATAPELSRIIREKALLREVIHNATALLKAAYDPQADPSEIHLETRRLTRIVDHPALHRRKIGMLESRDFASAKYQMNYLVDKVCVEKQNMMVGGVGKVLKTLIVGVEMGISIASGTAFLGQFRIPTKRRVAFLSGESGEFKLQDAALRVCQSKDINLADVNMAWGWDLPQLAKRDDLDALGRMIKDTGTEVLMIDPLYLCLLGGDLLKRQASNLFDMGSLLFELTSLAREFGITLCLMHHCAKHSADLSKPPDLKDLAFAGFAEWARQWILLGRRSEYVDGSGRHELWMRAGGSAGHGGLWAVDVNEGQVDEHLRGSLWSCDVSSGIEAREKSRREAASKSSERAVAVQDQRVEQLRKAFRKNPQGETGRILRLASCLNAAHFVEAIDILTQLGEVEECDIGKGKRQFAGWRPTEHMKGLDDDRPLLGSATKSATSFDSEPDFSDETG